MSRSICVFGEVLFDSFPDGQRVLGGAPFNVAWNLQALGEDVHFISRVGADDDGQRIRRAMQDWHMQTSALQSDPEHPSGRVNVSLNQGEPAYEIVAPSAYDKIEPPTGQPHCDLLYHGSLALRDPVSRHALAQILLQQPGLVFVDVNLRAPWWHKSDVLQLMAAAHWVKLNADELSLLSDSGTSDQQSAITFLQQHNLQGLILTHGGEGAEVLTQNGEIHTVKPEQNMPVVDTVGAGDAFASVMLLGLARDWPMATTLQRAQRFASSLVGQRGATVGDRAYYQAFTQHWN